MSFIFKRHFRIIDRKIIKRESERERESEKQLSVQFYLAFIVQKTINLIKFKSIYLLPKEKRSKKKIKKKKKIIKRHCGRGSESGHLKALN